MKTTVPFSSALLSALLCSAAFASTDPRTITVTGQCSKRIQPDRGTVTLVAQFVDKDARIASQKAAETYEKIRAAVQKMNLQSLELETSEYSVQELFDYVKSKRVSKGMQASIGLQVTTSSISKLGEVAALSSRFEINRVEALTTFLSAEQTKIAKESCLVQAIENARDKASKMVGAAGSQLGELEQIDENPAAHAVGGRAEMAMADMAPEAPRAKGESIVPGIESKPELIDVDVLVKFAIK